MFKKFTLIVATILVASSSAFSSDVCKVLLLGDQTKDEKAILSSLGYTFTDRRPEADLEVEYLVAKGEDSSVGMKITETKSRSELFNRTFYNAYQTRQMQRDMLHLIRQDFIDCPTFVKTYRK